MGRPSKVLISRERAAQAALDIIDVQGLNGLSLELVAKRIGVKAPSLYYHFKNKAELMSEVALAILRNVNAPEIDFENWDETIVELCLETRRTILQHPNAAPLLLEHFPRQIFMEPYNFWMKECPYKAEVRMTIFEGTEKLTFGSALFAAASRSSGVPAMPEYNREQFPYMADAVRANPYGEEAMFVQTIRMFLAGFADQKER